MSEAESRSGDIDLELLGLCVLRRVLLPVWRKWGAAPIRLLYWLSVQLRRGVFFVSSDRTFQMTKKTMTAPSTRKLRCRSSGPRT